MADYYLWRDNNGIPLSYDQMDTNVQFMDTVLTMSAGAAGSAAQSVIDAGGFAAAAGLSAGAAAASASSAAAVLEQVLEHGNGWTPVLSLPTDGARVVLQITDWEGGLGPKPTAGYVGPAGLTPNLADATDLRGPSPVADATGVMRASAQPMGPGWIEAGQIYEITAYPALAALLEGTLSPAVSPWATAPLLSAVGNPRAILPPQPGGANLALLTTANGIFSSPSILGPWTSRQSSTTRRAIKFVPELGLYFAVGINGTSGSYFTSTNGTAWTARGVTGWAGALCDVAWVGGRLLGVAVSSGTTATAIYESADGFAWSVLSSLSAAHVYQLATYGGLLCAIPVSVQTGGVQTSTTGGASWSGATFPAGATTGTAITFGAVPGLGVIVGWGTGSSSIGAVTLHATLDGRSFIELTGGASPPSQFLWDPAGRMMMLGRLSVHADEDGRWRPDEGTDTSYADAAVWGDSIVQVAAQLANGIRYRNRFGYNPATHFYVPAPPPTRGLRYYVKT